MTRLPGVDLEEGEGAGDENLRILAHKPEYVDLVRAISKAIEAPTEIDPVLKQIVELKVARLHGCEYSIDLLEAFLLKAGVGKDELHELDFHRDSSLFEDRTKLALTFAEKMILDAVDDEQFDVVRRTFGLQQTLELIVTVAIESFYSLVNRTLGLKPRGFRDEVPEADPAADIERA
jgi:AhpD family alkylhydroperoxidase